jgi:hypothetical protein
LPPAPLDDDPLTSPSFPAINASDSRSYRSSRHETQPGGGHGAPAYIEPAPQFGTYPPAGPPISPPNGYPVQSAAPAGNPYGSFVSQPAPGYQQQAPAASHQDAGYPAYPAVGQEAPGHGWYSSPTPADGAPAGGYQQPGGQVPNGLDQAGYHNGYQAAPPETAAYQQPPYPPQYDPRYVSPEAAYGSDAYQAYPGYTGGY